MTVQGRSIDVARRGGAERFILRSVAVALTLLGLAKFLDKTPL